MATVRRILLPLILLLLPLQPAVADGCWVDNLWFRLDDFQCSIETPLETLVTFHVELETWKDWSRLIDLAHLAVFRRPGADTRMPPAINELLAQHGCQDPAVLAREASGRVIVLEAEMLPISATEVRAKLARHADVGSLLPAAVWSYIRRHRLYGG